MMTQLDYGPPRPDDRTDWPPVLVILLAGIPVGVAVGFTSYAMALFGAPAGLVVGAAASYAARSRPLSYAARGGTVVGASAMLLNIVGIWLSGRGDDSLGLIGVSFVFVPVVFTLPGVIGGAVVCLARKWAG